MAQDIPFQNRELSWLSFNHRVLQEAKDTSVPLHEKIKFMAIFSSNLDEFFRVRVAALRNLLALKEKTQKKLDFNPSELLLQIHTFVHKQQEELGQIYREIIGPGLVENNIFLIDAKKTNTEQYRFIQQYFEYEVHPFLQPVFLFRDKVAYFLQNNALYLAVKLYAKSAQNTKSTRAKYAMLSIPTRNLPRFVTLPKVPDQEIYHIMLLDDVIRAFLPDIFPGYTVDSAYAIKLTRDAEIYIEDEFSGDLVDKIRKGISRRKTGVPARFLYDQSMPASFLKFIARALHLSKEDLIPGGRFHNFSDFFTFPQLGPDYLQYTKLKPVASKSFTGNKDMFAVIAARDVLLHFPYHSYQAVPDFIAQAARDAQVTAIFMTLYRVSSNSRIIENVILAAENGKKVTVFVEIKARFDEESNLKWAEELQRSGVNVLYSFPGLKVHAKLCLVKRSGRDFAYLATGNFNEKTSGIYTDFGLFTARKSITGEVQKVFDYLTKKTDQVQFSHLLVAPFNMRETFYSLIDNEIKNAREGKEAVISVKLNNLEDKKIIQKLYSASRAGVKIRLIIRGICCLVPGEKKHSENIEVFSVVDRYLEHTRIFVFHNAGRPKVFAGSADWMKRNLSRRIEVVFPILDACIKKDVLNILELQFADNTKSRIVSNDLANNYRRDAEEEPVNAQLATYRYIRSLDQ